MQTSSCNSTKPTLLSIPTELRLKIFSCLLDDSPLLNDALGSFKCESTGNVKFQHQIKLGLHVDLLRVCKQFYTQGRSTLYSNKTIEVDIVLSCCSNKSPTYVTGEIWLSDALNKYPALIDIKSWRINIHYINCKANNSRRHRTYAEPWLMAFLIRHDIETFNKKVGVLDQVELTFYDSSSRPQPNVRIKGCLMYTIAYFSQRQI